jgi:hypothetical protein
VVQLALSVRNSPAQLRDLGSISVGRVSLYTIRGTCPMKIDAICYIHESTSFGEEFAQKSRRKTEAK